MNTKLYRKIPRNKKCRNKIKQTIYPSHLNDRVVDQTSGQEKFLVAGMTSTGRGVSIRDHGDDVDPHLVLGVPVPHLVVLAGDDEQPRESFVDFPPDDGLGVVGISHHRHLQMSERGEGHPVARNACTQVDDLRTPPTSKLRQLTSNPGVELRAGHGSDAFATIKLDVLSSRADSDQIRLEIRRQPQVMPEK